MNTYSNRWIVINKWTKKTGKNTRDVYSLEKDTEEGSYFHFTWTEEKVGNMWFRRDLEALDSTWQNSLQAVIDGYFAFKGAGGGY